MKAHQSIASARFAVALITLAAGTSASRADPAARVELVPRDPRTFRVVVTSDTAFLGGEIGIGFRGDALVPVDVLRGDGFPEGSDPAVTPSVAWRETSLDGCPAGDVDSALVASWVHPRDPETGGVTALAPGRHAVLELRFERAPEAGEDECHAVRFLSCLGPSEAPVRNVITGVQGDSIVLERRDATSCAGTCRLLRFAPGQTADCEALLIELREPDGTSVIARREVTAAGLSGWDLALAVFASLEAEPVEGLSAGLLLSGVKLCRDDGTPLRIFLAERDPTVTGMQEVLGGETIGPCGVDVQGVVPDCPDADRDGRCDADDPCPDRANPGEPCAASGFCRRVKFDPLCAFTCERLTFELREPDGTTLIAEREIEIEGDGTGLDVAVALCRALGDPPPAGFEVERVPSGCQLCRLDGTAFRIFLRHLDDEGDEREPEITVGDVTAACGLRTWLQTPRCEDEGDADSDGDGVCDGVDNCPAVFNPSQADLDSDCAGDACVTLDEPFVPAGLCDGAPFLELRRDEDREFPAFTLDPCDRADCFAFEAPAGAPVAITLEGGVPDAVHRIWVSAEGAAGPKRFDLTARGSGGEPLRLTVPEASGDLHTVRVDLEEPGSAPSELLLRARAVELSLASIVPARGAAGGRIAAILRGGGFQAGEEPTTFGLVPRGDGDPIAAEDSVVLEIRFDSERLIRTQPVRNVFSLFLPAEPPEDPRPKSCVEAEDCMLDVECALEAEELARPVTPLSWAPARRAKSYDLIFWSPGEESLLLSGLEGTSVDPPARLEHDTLYRWQVIAKNVRGVETPGPVWCFRTAPAPRPCPEPPALLSADLERCDGPVVLAWERVDDASAYAVRTRRGGGPWKSRGSVSDRTTLEFSGLPPGFYEWQITALNESCNVPDWQRITATGEFEICGGFVRGDVDGNGGIDITDAIVTLGFLFLGTETLSCKDAADANDDGRINITDAVFVLQWLFLGKAPPPSPSPSEANYAPRDCGPDPTEDDLGCEEPPAVCRSSG